MAATVPRNKPKRKAFAAQRSTTVSGKFNESDEFATVITSSTEKTSLILRQSSTAVKHVRVTACA